MDTEKYIKALINLHLGIPHQGPADQSLSQQILAKIEPLLPKKPVMADLGCGTGSASLLLTKHFQSTIYSVDLAQPFLDQMMETAENEGLSHLIKAYALDMGNLGWEEEAFDLIWSEGAAYNLTFEGALKAWRPLLKKGGIAVISEISWFTDAPNQAVYDYWTQAYPAIDHEQGNIRKAENHGFEILSTHRLPSQSWWTSYYNPLSENIEKAKQSDDPIVKMVLEEMAAEMDFFKQHSDEYGYTFYVLKAK